MGKTDRRTIYTKNLIKDTLLNMLEKTSFDHITVAALCRQAEINRSTFYLHYQDLPAVFDELLKDALAGTNDLLEHLSFICRNEGACCTEPFCQKVQKEKYRVLFLDDTLTGRILTTLAGQFQERAVRAFTAGGKLSAEQAQALFLFQISGCLAVSKHAVRTGCTDFAPIRETLDLFIRDGFRRWFE